MLRRNLRKSQTFRLSATKIYRYLTKFSPSTEKNHWNLGKCTFGKAAAAFALALMSQDPSEVEELVQEGQKSLMDYNHHDKLYDLISTKWPVWGLLALLQKRVLTERRINEIEAILRDDETHGKESLPYRPYAPIQPLTKTNYPDSLYHEVPLSEYFPVPRQKERLQVVIVHSDSNASEETLFHAARRGVLGFEVVGKVGVAALFTDGGAAAGFGVLRDSQRPVLLLNSGLLGAGGGDRAADNYREGEEDAKIAADFMDVSVPMALELRTQILEDGEGAVLGFPSVAPMESSCSVPEGWTSSSLRQLYV